MAKKKAVGRPKKKLADKVKLVAAYLTPAQEIKVNNKYGNLSDAVRAEVLPKCG